MAVEETFNNKFTENSKDEEKLRNLLIESDDSEIVDAILENVNSEKGLKIWSSLLLLTNDEDKLLKIIEGTLPKLNRDQLSMKVLNDFYSRLCLEIPRFSLEFAVKLAYFCDTSIQLGDPRACFFKDVLPCVLQVLVNSEKSITLDGVTKTSVEHHHEIINAILKKPFRVSVLSNITSMFKDIQLNKQEMELLMGKICDNLPNVPQADVPRLALACFSLSLFNKLIIPILAFDSYFYSKRYMKKFVEMDSESDVDSIDVTAEKGVIETEENVIFHFQHVTEFTSIEKDIVTSLKPLTFAPKFIISPFIATVLVSFAKMSSSTVAGNLRLPQSILLPFMKEVFKNNEKHREIRKLSAWARSVERFEPIDIEKLLKVIQENTCKNNQNVALNGFIGLAFMLLKTSNSKLNEFAIQFLYELTRQRQEFTNDILKIIVKMLFSERNKAPIVECFSMVIQRRTLPLERCEDALVDLIENLTELELDTALGIESVIHNTIIRSTKLRDLMLKTMRTAMYQNKPEMRKLAVYSFCAMLKKVKKPRQGTSNEFFGASQNLSMMSLLSQSQLPIGDTNMRRVSVLVLEILGILRKCFSHSVEIRECLYESLLDAASANEFIIPTVLEMVEPYFRDYFDSEEPDTIINFSKAFKQLENGEFVVMDQVGKFLNFFVVCSHIGEEKEVVEEENFQMSNLKKILEKLVGKICEISLESLGVFSMIDLKASEVISQYLNCLQALMVHCSYDLTNENVDNISKLFEKHQTTIAEAKKIHENGKKSMKKGKNQTEISIAPGKKVELLFDCLWDVKTCGKFLKIFFEKNLNEKINEIRQNSQLCRLVLKTTGEKFLELSTAPDRLKFRHSRSTFTTVAEHSAIIYKQLKLEIFSKLYNDFDATCAVAVTETFKDSFTTFNEIYNSPPKWLEFLEKVTGSKQPIDQSINEILKTAQKIIDWIFDAENEFHCAEEGEKIVLNLLATMEILFLNFQAMPNQFANGTFTWLLRFCTEHEIHQKNLHVLNRVLFNFMVQQGGCTVQEAIAYRISTVYSILDEEVEPLEASSRCELLSITKTTVDQAFFAFAAVIKRQIEDVEFCINRLNSYNAMLKIPGQLSHRESAEAMKVLEMSSVIKMATLGKIIARLCNTKFGVAGTQIETIGRTVISYFICLCSLLRHFNAHFDVKSIDCQFIPVEMLLKEVKVTVKRAYALVPYIESLYESEQEKTSKTKKKKPLVVKEFKFSSRLVGFVEKFATLVQRFDKLAHRNFSKHVNFGEVRSFKITVERMEVDESERDAEKSDEEGNVSDKSSEPSTNSSVKKTQKNRRKRLASSSDESEKVVSDEEDTSLIEPQELRPEGFEENLKKINEKVKKRASRKKK